MLCILFPNIYLRVEYKDSPGPRSFWKKVNFFPEGEKAARGSESTGIFDWG